MGALSYMPLEHACEPHQAITDCNWKDMLHRCEDALTQPALHGELLPHAFNPAIPSGLLLLQRGLGMWMGDMSDSKFPMKAQHLYQDKNRQSVGCRLMCPHLQCKQIFICLCVGCIDPALVFVLHSSGPFPTTCVWVFLLVPKC